MDEPEVVQRQQRMVPTYARVWRTRWMIRGIPNGPTFWRPIDGWAAVAFFITMFVDWRVIKKFHIPTGFYTTLLVYVGLPFLIGWYTTRINRNGKRPDVWLMDYVRYWAGPKVWDRFEPVRGQGATQTASLESPVAVVVPGKWWAR